ncbi:MAG: hypothetical protein LBL47_02925 [Lactobacillus sp.]|nr:hypothetical protein [Lactobacillus sp.]
MIVCLVSTYLFRSLAFALFFVVNFFSISDSANIFTNAETIAGEPFKMIYVNDVHDLSALAEYGKDNNVELIAFNNLGAPVDPAGVYPYIDYQTSQRTSILSIQQPISQNRIMLSSDIEASYVLVKAGERVITVINLDLKGMRFGERSIVFSTLFNFINRQDNPVVIVGDFDMPAFVPTFKEFLIKSQLEVKNHVVFYNMASLFKSPSINVLGYKNVGVEKVTRLNSYFSSSPAVLFELSVE